MIAIVLSVVAALLVLGGLRYSGKSQRPRLLQVGTVVAALGIMLLWVLPWWLLSADRGPWAMPMFVGSLFVAVSILGGGLQLMRRACGVSDDSPEGGVFEDFVRQNHLP